MPSYEDHPIFIISLEPGGRKWIKRCCDGEQIAFGLTKFPVKSSMESQTAEASSHDATHVRICCFSAQLDRRSSMTPQHRPGYCWRAVSGRSPALFSLGSPGPLLRSASAPVSRDCRSGLPTTKQWSCPALHHVTLVLSRGLHQIITMGCDKQDSSTSKTTITLKKKWWTVWKSWNCRVSFSD